MESKTQHQRIETALREVDAALSVAKAAADNEDQVIRALRVAETALQHAWQCSGNGRAQFCEVATAALECALGLAQEAR
jgi:hypothetical protein